MTIINEVFATIKNEIITAIKMSENPYSAARLIAVNFNLDAPTARLLLEGVEEIFDTYNN